MRIFIAVLVLIFSLQSWTKADDIRDIQIEGMSIGDSALDYFSEEKILNNRVHYFKDKKFTPVEISYAPFFEVYWLVSFAYKSEDKKYIIERLSGAIDFSNNIKNCKKEKNKIMKEISSSIKGIKFKNYPEEAHTADPSGKSRVWWSDFRFKNGDMVIVQCTDYAEETGWVDHLSVELRTNDFNKFLNMNPCCEPRLYFVFYIY